MKSAVLRHLHDGADTPRKALHALFKILQNTRLALVSLSVKLGILALTPYLRALFTYGLQLCPKIPRIKVKLGNAVDSAFYCLLSEPYAVVQLFDFVPAAFYLTVNILHAR